MLPGDLFKFWVNMLTLARLNNGRLPSISSIAFKVRCTVEQADESIAELMGRNLLECDRSGYFPHDWEEHQYPSDSSTERSRKSRQRSRNGIRNGDATLQQRPRIEEIRIEEKREEQTTTKPQHKFKPLNLDEVRLCLMEFPGAKKLQGMPDDSLLIKCCAMAGNNVDELAKALRGLALSGKKPELSWGWFLTVLPSKLNGAAR